MNIPGMGPKIVVNEIVRLIDFIIQQKSLRQSENNIVLKLCDNQTKTSLDEKYPCLRFA